MFPIVDRPSGVVEIIGETSADPHAYLFLDLGVIRLHSDPPADVAERSFEPLELGIAARIQEGEYLVMKPTDETLPTHTLVIARGVATRRGDEVPRNFDPADPPSNRGFSERDFETALLRWREEAATGATAPPHLKDELSPHGGPADERP